MEVIEIRSETQSLKLNIKFMRENKGMSQEEQKQFSKLIVCALKNIQWFFFAKYTACCIIDLYKILKTSLSCYI